MLDITPRDKFLEHIPFKWRGTMSNCLLKPIREGLTDPGDILDAAYEQLKANRHWQEERNGLFMKVMQDHYNEAYDCVRYYQDYEKLSFREKQGMREQASVQARQYWSQHKREEAPIDDKAVPKTEPEYPTWSGLHEGIFHINLNNACFGLIVRNGRIVAAPPFARWCVGKNARDTALFYQRKGAVVTFSIVTEYLNENDE